MTASLLGGEDRRARQTHAAGRDDRQPARRDERGAHNRPALNVPPYSLRRFPSTCHHSVDRRKSHIKALDRIQPGLPMKKGRARTMTHDYKMQWHASRLKRPAIRLLSGRGEGRLPSIDTPSADSLSAPRSPSRSLIALEVRLSAGPPEPAGRRIPPCAKRRH